MSWIAHILPILIKYIWPWISIGDFLHLISGIPIVKLEDTALAKEVGLFAFPSIVFFRNFGKEAVIYAGDIKNEDSILEWLLVQMDPSNEAIEDAEGEELESAIENYDSIAVFICKKNKQIKHNF